MHYAWLRYVLRKSYARAMQGLCKGCGRAVHAAFSVEGGATGPIPSDSLNVLHLQSLNWQPAKCPRHQQQKTAKPCPPQRCHCKGSAICKHCIVHWALVMDCQDCPFEATSALEMDRNGMGMYGMFKHVWIFEQCSSVLFSPSHGDATNPCSLMNIPRLNSIVCLGILIYWTRFLVAFSPSLPSTWRVRTQISWGYSKHWQDLTNVQPGCWELAPSHGGAWRFTSIILESRMGQSKAARCCKCPRRSQHLSILVYLKLGIGEQRNEGYAKQCHAAVLDELWWLRC